MTNSSTIWRIALFGYLGLAAIDLIFTFFLFAPHSDRPATAYLNGDEWLVWGVLLVPLFGVGFRRRILSPWVWRIVLAAIVLWAGYEFIDELSYKLWLHERDPANANLLTAIWVTELVDLAVAALWYALPLLALFLHAFRRSDIWHPSQSSGTPPAPDGSAGKSCSGPVGRPAVRFERCLFLTGSMGGVAMLVHGVDLATS
jgi:predicted membrane protein